jgi:tetratricopeptide (TPR) repeat protein
MQGPPLAAFAERRSGVEMAETARYRAFISYSHRDAAFAARLHRRLEGYRLPAHLAPGGDRRLSPIFKDREELPAASDLSTQVQAALAVSDVLIIVCSPDAAASPWVGREIETFRALHPDRPVLAALVRGEPAEAFHPALSASGAEPLAADFRKAGDGERLAFLKLVAGLAGVGLDRLIQRDGQRRLRGVIAVTAASVTAMLAMGTMLIFALDARAEAERQRGEAESLVDFMLTDLRDRLEGVAQTRVTVSVNERVLAYYRAQDLSRLPAKSLVLRAKSLHAMGEDEIRRGNYDQADKLFAEAYRTTAAVLEASPGNPELVYEHAQSEYWLGYAAFVRKQPVEARSHFQRYRALAQKLRELEPATARSFRELAYAEGNLCSVAVELVNDGPAAVASCKPALEYMRRAVEIEGDTESGQADVANRHGWLADAYRADGKLELAQQHRLDQLAILDRLLAAHANVQLTARWIGTRKALSIVAAEQGRFDAAHDHLEAARKEAITLAAWDPENTEWQGILAEIGRTQRYLDRKKRESEK